MAIAWGRGDWGKMSSELLLRVQVTPVHSPDTRPAGQPLTRPEQLLRLPLLHQHSHQGWQRWFEAAGVSYPGSHVPGSVIEDTNVLLQAVLDGHGVGLGFLPLIEDDLASGRLVQPFTLRIEPAEAYYLLYEPRAMQRESAREVRDWLRRHLAQSPV